MLIKLFIASFMFFTLVCSAYSAESAKIMHKKKSNIGWKARVTVKVQSSIALKSWVNCNYYDKEWEVIASTNHVLNERVPTWTVKADYNNIENIICNKGG